MLETETALGALDKNGFNTRIQCLQSLQRAGEVEIRRPPCGWHQSLTPAHRWGSAAANGTAPRAQQAGGNRGVRLLPTPTSAGARLPLSLPPSPLHFLDLRVTHLLGSNRTASRASQQGTELGFCLPRSAILTKSRREEGAGSGFNIYHRRFIFVVNAFFLKLVISKRA